MSDLPRSVVEEGRRILDERGGTSTGTAHTSSSDDAPASVEVYEAETLAELAANPPAPASFLLRRYWPSDAYGVVAAPSKAGKTWLALDIAVAVATGGRALGAIDVDRPGRVLVFLGEGGRRNAWRRLRAVCEYHDLDPAKVDGLHLVYRSPSLNDTAALADVERLVAEVAPVLVIVDPLYLAAAGSDGASLYSMAGVLERAQRIAEAVGSALMLVHHYNQTGKGSGPGRMSGAGPEEWGRVLWSVDVDRGTSTYPEGSVAHLTVNVRGGEVADAAFAVTREVWSDDPDDLDALMHYELTPGEVRTGTGRKLSAQDRALRVLADDPDAWLTPSEVQDLDAEWSHLQPDYGPIKTDTVSRALSGAAKAGLCRRKGGGPNDPALYMASRSDA